MARISARPFRFMRAAGLAVTIVGAAAAGPDAAEQLRFGPGIINHPVHVRPSDVVSIPPGWPLAKNGTLTCTTCHKALPSREAGADPQLRASASSGDMNATFCRNCHTTNGERTAAGMHWLVMGRAHIKDDRPARGGGSIDAESRRCMGCHDGVSASEFSNTTPSARLASYAGDSRHEHPVGVPYAQRADRRGDTRIRHESLLPATVRLPDGRVSCVSCHNLYSIERYRLSVPIEGSQLCLTCHQME